MIEKLLRLFSDKNSTQSMVAFMSASSLVNNVINMAAGLLVARWLMPEQLGFFTGFSIITSYIVLAQLGIPSGLSRELPLFMGKGEETRAREMASVANYYELALGLAISGLAVILSAYFLITGNYPYAAGVFVIGFTSFQGVYVVKYLKVLYRSNRDFNKLSLIGLIGTAVAALSVVFVWKWGFYGLCLRALTMFLADFYFTWKWRPIDARPAWNKEAFRHLMKEGFPIYWVANVYGLWPVLQRTIVISYLGTRSMGLYSLALMVDTSMRIIANSLSSVTFPKMAHAWGKGADIKRLILQSRKIIAASLAANILIGIAATFLLVPFVKFFLPNYTEGIPAAQWMVWIGVIGVLGVYQNIYMVVQKNMDRLYSFIVAVAVWMIALWILFMVFGPVLSILPQSLLAGYMAMYLVNFYHFRKYAIHGVS